MEDWKLRLEVEIGIGDLRLSRRVSLWIWHALLPSKLGAADSTAPRIPPGRSVCHDDCLCLVLCCGDLTRNLGHLFLEQNIKDNYLKTKTNPGFV